jgi:hypothetical protein
MYNKSYAEQLRQTSSESSGMIFSSWGSVAFSSWSSVSSVLDTVTCLALTAGLVLR